MDLDHVIPNVLFGSDWRNVQKCLPFEQRTVEFNTFWNERKVVGNSIGNFRWLDASQNKAQNAANFEAAPIIESDQVFEADKIGEWEELRKDWARAWNAERENGTRLSKEQVAQFQRLVDLRTLHLMKTLIEDGGLAGLAGVGAPEEATA